MGKRAWLILPGVLVLAIGWAALAGVAPEVTVQARPLDGGQAGEILIGERPVITIRTGTDDLSPLERAEIIATRLRAALAAGPAPGDVRAGQTEVGGATYDAVFVGDRLIATVTSQEADSHGASPAALAQAWRDNIIVALGGTPPPPQQASVTQPAATPASAAAVDWTGTAQKWVPIFSLENTGAAIGAAQVAGPTSQVGKTKAVMQLRLDFRGFGRIYAYVPVASISTRLDRVQGVSVWAVGDVQLARF